jgi:zinc protease
MNVEGLSPGYFAIYIGTAPEKLDAARSGILDHLKRLIDAAPDELEVEHARRHMIGNHAIDQQRNATRAAHMALDSLYGLGPDAQRSYPAQIAAISREDVLRVARRFFRLDACTIATVCP